MSSLKRMIYIWEENEKFYSDIPNKSEFINKLLSLARKEQETPRVKPEKHIDPRIVQIRAQVAAMEEKARKARG